MARAREVPPDRPEDAPTREIRRDEEVVEERLPPPLEPRAWWRENLWAWLLALLVLVVGGIALLWFLQRDSGPSDRVIVPAVVGMTEAEAIRAILNADLEPVVNRNESPKPQGEVYSQAPGGGSRLKKGEPVVVNVSTGPPTTTTVTTTVAQPPPPAATVTVQDVVGLSQVDAGEVLEGDGIVADSYPVPSDEPAGTVISQSPAPGTELKEGDTVRLNVSIAPGARETSEIPDLTGPPASEARQRARVEGFTVRTLIREAPSREEVGEVLDQRPRAGTTAPILTQITLFVGR